MLTQSKLIHIVAFVLILNTSYLIINTLSFPIASAQTATDLQQKIDQRNLDIKGLEKEIQTYQKQIDDLGTQAGTLASTIKSLQLNQKKIETNIAVTEDKIAAKNLEIQQLGTQIGLKQNDIEDDTRIVAHSFRELNQLSAAGVTNIIIGSNSISGAMNTLDELGMVQKSLFDKISSLGQAKDALETNRAASEKAKGDLFSLSQQLGDQRKAVLATVSEQNVLLKETNQSEVSYKKLLAEKKAQKDAFENEIAALEATLKYSVDPSSIPTSGRGVLAYPLDSIRITQYFGLTEFATQNPQVYNGQGHNGVDFAASIGTPIKSAGSGTVIGVGNTDAACPNASFGKWIMIDHGNGLSTLYGHLSVQSVSVNQKVKVGEIIGYSGNTGYTTGPHLHFGVYASSGVAIDTYKFKSCQGASVKMPILTKKNAYLNPLSYL